VGPLYWKYADESGMRSDHHAGTTWTPAGRTPVVKATGCFSFNMLSAVNAQGQFRFLTVESRVTASVFLDCDGPHWGGC
jgi:hypothetical protein